MIEKLKIYLDTSVISYLAQEDVPEKMADTKKLWEIFKTRKYDLYLSTVTLQEIADCPEPKRSILYRHLREINYNVIDVTGIVSDIAHQLVDMKILPPKSYDDCQHIAAAVEYAIEILNPSVLLESEE